MIFDGTTRLCEAMAIVRFIDSNWLIQQRLIRFQLIAQSMSGEQVARELITALSIQYRISSSSLLAAMRDRASVNDVAIRTIKVIYPALLDVGCFSHTLDLVGGKFSTLHFMSPKARLLWRESICFELLTNTLVEPVGAHETATGAIWRPGNLSQTT